MRGKKVNFLEENFSCFPYGIRKRAQFFILAAVILSVVIISLGTIANKATINREPGNFYDYTYEIKKESGAIMDWELFSDFEAGANLTKFVDLLAADTIDKYPDANFLFIYGNTEVLTVKNYGVEEASVDGDSIEGLGSSVFSGIKLTDTAGTEVTTSLGSYGYDEGIILGARKDLLIEVAGQAYNFLVTEDNQVLFVIQKTNGGDNYVAVE